MILCFQTDGSGQTVQTQSLIRVYKVCNSVCIFWTHYSPIKPPCSNFRVIETKHFSIWATSWQNQQSECAPSEDSDQPGHPPSLIGVFAVRMKKAWTLSYPLSAQRRLWSDWADAQADLSLRWAHSHIVSFVMSRLICMVYVSAGSVQPFRILCDWRWYSCVVFRDT